MKDIAFVGNELLDIALAEEVGLPIAVANAVEEMKDICAYVTGLPGGEGAVREILECWFESVGRDPKEFIV
jgi:3-deoxy-D-manno-octulosonate 8-phosphate phosphatase (KDO 8-P phosphatase)